ncbi:prolyl oligopeptidase family serine peptidase [Hwangdonia lutea]|uniref:Prolyl oligopeptidase family serine peptidase n=1 Tax=Hwangdonia lutea TaxID=3075823 RepID=A0AA97EPV0_9FLAO|nr:prolyl oligopeptidase family serine peptidase [Hwangdonia sp. SCSIO 19198]WOD45187.1 prolyl oligopeptidase family serine peptidase [Hwangdonia sp. SCSIO 19198]
MGKHSKNILILIFIGATNMLTAQHEAMYSKELYISQSDTLQYRMMMPKDFDDSKQYPIILFLHGAGERGSDNKAQLVHGSKLFASDENREKFPAIVIFPQCPKNSYWANARIDRSTNPLKIEFPLDIEPTKPLNLVMQLMDEISAKPYVNKNKIYIGGLSMGGMGTFEMVYRKPQFFAAAISICGAGNPEATKAYAKTTPFWVFHGANDNVVNPLASVNMVEGMLKNGGKPNFTLYANDNHNSWDSAFAEPQFLPWLFSNIKQ